MIILTMPTSVSMQEELQFQTLWFQEVILAIGGDIQVIIGDTQAMDTAITTHGTL